MGTVLAALLNLQSIERKLANVRSRLRIRQNAVLVQQRRIEELREKWQAAHDMVIAKKMQADSLDIDLKQRDAEIIKYRAALNTAKSNKEYAAILTQMNTLKADNSKFEEQELQIMQETETFSEEAKTIQQQIAEQEKLLEDVTAKNSEELARLEAMMQKLQGERDDAAKEVPPTVLALFNRIATSYDGEAMAAIEISGKKPPFSYICGGCFMSLNAEHANALHVKDEIRTCDNCGRILYMEPSTEASQAT